MFGEKIHRYIFLFGLFGLAFGMMIGTVPTSVPQLVLFGNWLIEMDFKRKWLQLKSNKLFWIMSAIFLAHVVGMIWTRNIGAGIDDIRTKMPLMFLPLVFFSTRFISQKEFHVLLYCFLAGCVVNTLWCMLYSFLLHHTEVVRNSSRFMSHIRLGLYLNVAISCCVYFITRTAGSFAKALFVLLVFYFLFVLYALGLATGLINFALLFFLALCYIIYKQNTIIKIVSFLVLIVFLSFLINYFVKIKDTQLVVKQSVNNAPLMTNISGKSYIHFDSAGRRENGNYIHINIQLTELQKEWKLRFPEDSFSYVPAYNLNRYEILIRYLASKGLNKDSAGIAQLSEEDLMNVQKNIPNYQYPEWSFLHKRTYELVNEYDEFMNTSHVNGHSLTMRLYFWKAAVHVIKKNFLFGVGTGDVQDALNEAYTETNSPLDKEWYKRPHNQFLTITTALGIFGLIIFLWSVFYPAMLLRKELTGLFWPFFIIAVFSFLLEDTLETQAGLTFYAFFYSAFAVKAYYKKYSTN